MKVTPFNAAVERLKGKIPVGSPLATAGWVEVPLDMRERALFTARLENVTTLQTIQEKLVNAASLGESAPGKIPMDRARFVSDMRAILGKPENNKSLTDLASSRRLKLIYDFQMKEAHAYGRWKQGQDADMLDLFPALELVRIGARKDQRPWGQIWGDKGGQLYGGRMIAPVNDPIWTAISKFGKPWPPFDFGSGMGLRKVGRAEAERLGVIQPGEKPAPEDKAFNDELSASTKGLDAEKVESLKEAFGDQIIAEPKTGRVAWVGAGKVLEKAFQEVTAGTVPNDVNLGRSAPYIRDLAAAAKATSQPKGAPAFPGLTGAEKIHVTGTQLVHIQQRHGVDGEKDKSHLPVTPDLLRLAVEALTRPDEVRWSEADKGWLARRTIEGAGEYHVAFDLSKEGIRIRTVYIKKVKTP